MEKYTDESHDIAIELIKTDTDIVEAAHLAHQHITTLHLSYVLEAYKNSRKVLYDVVKRNLMRYVTTDDVLKEEKFIDLYCRN